MQALQLATRAIGGHHQGTSHALPGDAQRVASGHHAQQFHGHPCGTLGADVAMLPCRRFAAAPDLGRAHAWGGLARRLYGLPGGSHGPLLELVVAHAPAVCSGHLEQGARPYTLARFDAAPGVGDGAAVVVVSPGAPVVERVEVQASSLRCHASTNPFFTRQVGRDGVQRIAGAVDIGGHQDAPPFIARACAMYLPSK